MLGGGGILIAMNWKCLTDGTFCGLVGGGGTEGNCTYDLNNSNFTWTGNHTVCVSGHTVVQNSSISINCAGATSSTKCTKEEGCNKARNAFLNKFPNIQCPGGGGNCSGGYVKTSIGCVCNPTVKGCTSSASCVHMTGTTCQCLAAGTNQVGSGSGCLPGQYRCKLSNGHCGCCSSGGGGCTRVCTGGFMKNNATCTCDCNRDIKHCGPGQISVIVGTGSAATCGCYNCNQGFHREGNRCVVNTGGNVNACGAQANPAQAWIGRVATAILGRMCNNCGKNPGITAILQGWPALTQQCALENGCSNNKLHKTSAVFNKHFAQLLIAIRNAYRVPITVNAANALAVQLGNGVYWLTPWDGGVVGFVGQVNQTPNPFNDNRPGDSYARALEGRYNRWNPYGDNRYSYTLPTSMKVRVS